MQAQVLNIRPIARIRRSHRLPVPGNVLVRPGQKVSSGDLLAEVDLPIAQATVDVVRALGLSSPQEAEQLIQHKAGERLEEKDIIAETGGLFSRVIRTRGGLEVPIQGTPERSRSRRASSIARAETATRTGRCACRSRGWSRGAGRRGALRVGTPPIYRGAGAWLRERV